MLVKIKKKYDRTKWGIRQYLFSLNETIHQLRKIPKPGRISWGEFFKILRQDFVYQTLVFPNNVVIRHSVDGHYVDSRKKWKLLKLPNDFSQKRFMDIGCAEGYFVIQAVLAGAIKGIGCDLIADRLEIASIVAKAWNVQEKTEFHRIPLAEVPNAWASDIVTCLSVLHHLHKGSHDTWRIVTHSKQYNREFVNMKNAVAMVAKLTLEKTFWEYAYEYEEGKPSDVDYEVLARLWEEQGHYKKVDFIGLSLESKTKDRAIYHAYK